MSKTDTNIRDCEGGVMVIGYWPKDDLRRAFVSGAKWWEWRKEGATMWNSDVREVEDEAEKRYPGGKVT